MYRGFSGLWPNGWLWWRWNVSNDGLWIFNIFSINFHSFKLMKNHPHSNLSLSNNSSTITQH